MDYSYIIIPIIVGITSQVLKLLTDGIKGNFDLKNIFISYGGLPSSHTAFSVSITTLIGLRLGIASPVFAVAFVFTVLVVRDAISFRGMIGKQAKLFNKLISGMTDAERKDIPYFKEKIGHSFLEVFAGALWGAGLTYALSLFQSPII